MNYVEPIRDPTKVEDISIYLRKYSERNYIMFQIGIFSGLRISDILKLRVRDIKNKDYISIREQKTGKLKIFPIIARLKKDLKKYIECKEPSEYLIKSREGYNKPITRKQAYNIIREAGEVCGVYNLGTHTMRKTFGYHFYMQYKDVVALQEIFNHSTPEYTLRYIGIKQSHINKMIKNFKIY